MIWLRIMVRDLQGVRPKTELVRIKALQDAEQKE